MRLTFVISSLAAGGAERVASTLVNYWANGGDEITFVTIETEETDFYPLDAQVRRIALKLSRQSSNVFSSAANSFQRVRVLRRLIRVSTPDVIVSFGDKTNVLVLLAALGSDVPVVVSERTDPTQISPGRVVEVLRRLLYPRATSLVVQTQAVRLWARRISKDAVVWVIPNPARQLLPTVRTDRDRSNPTVLAMGRMDNSKGFDLLLPAFAECAPKHPNWTLRIIGEGPDRAQLRMLARRLDLESLVRLDTIVADPASAFMSADLFVLSSRFEGFPNVLLEAMACGLPVISFDCPSGPSEIIRDGVDGILVPPNDVAALAKAMDRLMGAENERKRLAACAIQVTERFSLSKVVGMWREVLDAAQATAWHHNGE